MHGARVRYGATENLYAYADIKAFSRQPLRGRAGALATLDRDHHR